MNPIIYPHADTELRDWLRWAEGNGGGMFLEKIATAARIADLLHYELLRPVLLKLKEMHPAS